MDHFVIVIEADHKRAAAAYSKGLEDLDRVMPQLMASAAARDEDQRLSAARREADETAELAAYHRAQLDYEEWQERPRWSKGSPCPPLPRRPLSMFSIGLLPYLSHHALTLESVREDLVHMRNVAQAAMGPYRMTEWQVRQMVGWEDGSRVEGLQRKYAEKEVTPLL